MHTTIDVLEPSGARLILPLFDQGQQIHVAAHPHLFRGDASEDEREAFLRSWLSQDAMTALVALSGEGRAVGYLIHEIREREAGAVQRASRTGFLHHIAVDASHRGHGIGSRLIEAMKGRLRETGITTLQSDYFVFNEASAALMRSAGLVPLRMMVEGKI